MSTDTAQHILPATEIKNEIRYIGRRPNRLLNTAHGSGNKAVTKVKTLRDALIEVSVVLSSCCISTRAGYYNHYYLV